MALIIHVDGGARGNPGPAGAGVVIRSENGTLIHEAAYFLGRQTNNAAEYHALIRALQLIQRCDPQPVVVHSDSELLVRQITGQYRVKSPKLAPLHEQVQVLLLKVARWSLRHVKREENQRADELANLAMDQRRDVIVFDADTATAAPGQAPDAVPEAEHPTTVVQEQNIRVTVSRTPAAGDCPAGGIPVRTFTVASTLPAGLCVHAAHAILPTLLAMLNTEPQEFAALPTLTVRCGRPGCRAEFQLSAIHSSNGAPRRKD